jgi:hypothetical protein
MKVKEYVHELEGICTVRASEAVGDALVGRVDFP